MPLGAHHPSGSLIPIPTLVLDNKGGVIDLGDNALVDLKGVDRLVKLEDDLPAGDCGGESQVQAAHLTRVPAVAVPDGDAGRCTTVSHILLRKEKFCTASGTIKYVD